MYFITSGLPWEESAVLRPFKFSEVENYLPIWLEQRNNRPVAILRDLSLALQ
jgi:hypothetical protein